MHCEPNLAQAPWSVLLDVACPLGVLILDKRRLLAGFWSVLDMLQLRASCRALRGGMTTKDYLTAMLKSSFNIEVGLPFYERGVPMPVSLLTMRFDQLLQNSRSGILPGRDPDHHHKEWLVLLFEEATKQLLFRVIVGMAEQCGCAVAGSFALHDHLRQTKAKNVDWIPGDVDLFGTEVATRAFYDRILDCTPSHTHKHPYVWRPYATQRLPDEDAERYVDEMLADTDELRKLADGVAYNLDRVNAYLDGGPPAAAASMGFGESDSVAVRGSVLAPPEHLRPLETAGWLSGNAGTEPRGYKILKTASIRFHSRYFPWEAQPGKDDREEQELQAGPLYRRHFDVNLITVDQVKDVTALLNGFDLDPAKVNVRLPPYATKFEHTFGDGAKEAIDQRVMRRTRACFRPCQIVTRLGGKPFFLTRHGPLDRLGERVLKYQKRGFRLERC